MVLEVGGGFGGYAAVKIQSIGAAIERLTRVEVPDFRLEPGNLCAGYVGRVADDEVKTQAAWQLPPGCLPGKT